MTEQVPHIEIDWRASVQRASSRDPMEEFCETMSVAAYRLVENLQNKNQQLKSELEYERKKNEYLIKLLEQYGIPVPDFSLGMPPAIPPNIPRQGRCLDANGGQPSLLRKDGTFNIPKILDTERVQKYFKAALEQGYMKINGEHFDWVGVGLSGRKAQLAYFCGCIFNYKHSVSGNAGDVFPDEELCTLFQEKYLYKALRQAHEVQKKQKWRYVLDPMFED